MFINLRIFASEYLIYYNGRVRFCSTPTDLVISYDFPQTPYLNYGFSLIFF